MARKEPEKARKGLGKSRKESENTNHIIEFVLIISHCSVVVQPCHSRTAIYASFCKYCNILYLNLFSHSYSLNVSVFLPTTEVIIYTWIWMVFYFLEVFERQCMKISHHKSFPNMGIRYSNHICM